MPGETLDFRVLGPFEVDSDGRDLTPVRPKQRLLLAALVLRANAVVATDDVVDVLWGPTPPATAHKALHGHVSALRKLLGPAKIETRPPGYLLHADAGSIDAHRFEDLVEAAGEETDPARRRDLLRAALALFRGEPLAEFRYEPFARDEAARLEGLRLRALEDRIDAELQLGRDRELIPELEQLVAEHPYEEHPRAALMLALYRAGRQTQALETYADARRLLVDELGIEPGPVLQRLERQILNQDPALSPPQRGEVAPTNLPRPAEALIGRADELEDVRARLLEDDGRLWTLTGAAGTGKTTLAVQAAADLSEHFPDGTFFVGLAPLADPGLVFPTIADAVGVDKGAAVNVAEVLQQNLAHKKLLLVLDNFEHLLDAAPGVSDLVATTRNLEVLATSREPLHVAGERVYPVPPLQLPAATRLFVERAQALQPEFRLSESNSTAVAEICRRLDGLPLAIELAAARITLFPPASLLGRLDERLKLLTGGGRDRPERHQTLRAAIDWSHELLSESQRELFAQLSVFAGGWTLEAAEGVCNGKGDVDVINGLASLIDKNLVRREGTEDEPRFTMLETIREYARERLQTGGDADTRRRHAEYFLAVAKELEPALVGRGGREAQRRLFAELDNIRAALTWAIDAGAATLALDLIWALWRFWWDHSLAAESHAWCEAALAAAPDAPLELRGRALFAAADLYYARGDWDEYRRALAEAVVLLEASGDEEFLLYAFWAIAVTDHVQGDQDAADRRALDALVRAEAGNYAELIGRLNVLLGAGALMRGDVVAARVYFEAAAEKHQEIGDAYGKAVALENLAIAAVLGRDPVTAADALAECLGEWDFSQNIHNLGHSLVVGAGIAQMWGEEAFAARLLASVAAHFERLGIILQPFEARIDAETRKLVEVELGAGRYREELERGAGNDLANELPLVMESLRRWATSGLPAESSRPTTR